MHNLLYDSRGNPFPNAEERKRAESLLYEYVAINKSKFDDWFRAHGRASKPPVKYNLQKREWYWEER